MSCAAFFRRPAVVLILGLCLIGGGVSVLSRLVTGPSTEPKRVALPHEAGAEASPAFSPDGLHLAFSAREPGKDRPFHIHVRSVAGGDAKQLTGGPAGEQAGATASDFGPAWSPDGATLAFLRVDEDRARYMVIPAAGGTPRQVADFPLSDPPPGPQSAVCWTRDGQSLYLVAWEDAKPPFVAAVPVAGGAPRRITQPPAGSHGDSSPSISPDGATLAFVRQSPDRAEHNSDGDGSAGSDVFLADVSGDNPRRLTFENSSIHGIAWSANGRDVVYAASRLDQEKLWRVAASGGSPRNAMAVGKNPAFPAVAPSGHRLAFTETPALDAIWRVDLTAADPAASARLLIHSDAREFAPRWSPDGQKIASISTQTGNQEIWVSDADGSHRAPITHMKAFQLWWPRWSPDGRTISFVERANGELNVNRVPSDGRGEPARIPLPQGTHQATWSHDGQSIYFSLMSVMKARADGQQQKKLTDNWGDHEPDESVDGKYVYFRRDRSIWRVHTTGEAAAEEEVIVPDHDARVPAFQTAAAGLYYLERDRDERTVAIRFYDFQTKKSRELVRLPVADPSAVSDFSVSPDGRTVLYSTVDRSQTTLVLTENFR